MSSKRTRIGTGLNTVFCELCSKYFTKYYLPRHMWDMHPDHIANKEGQAVDEESAKADGGGRSSQCNKVGGRLGESSSESLGESRARPARARRVSARIRDGLAVAVTESVQDEKASKASYKLELAPKRTVAKKRKSKQPQTNQQMESEAGTSNVEGSGEEGPKCPICNEATVDFQAMAKHMLGHVESKKRKVFACEECTEEFERKAELMKHKVVHEESKKPKLGEEESFDGDEDDVDNFEFNDDDGYNVTAEQGPILKRNVIVLKDVTESKEENSGGSTSVKKTVKRGKAAKKKRLVFCILCQNGFFGLAALNEHRRDVHGQGPLGAARPIANPLPSRKRTTVGGKTAPASDPNRPGFEYCCTICGEGPMTYRAVNEHRLSRHGAGPLEMGVKVGVGQVEVGVEPAEMGVQDNVGVQTAQSDSEITINQVEVPVRKHKIKGGPWEQVIENAIDEKQDDEDLSCKVCGEVFDNQSDLNKHNELEHVIVELTVNNPDLMQCPVCSKVFSTTDEFQEHLQTPCTETIEAELVEYSKNQDTVTNSVDATVQRAKPRHKCPVCNQEFLSLKQLELHEKGHPEMRYYCEHCGLIFRTKRGLQHHTVREHGHDTDHEFICEGCDKVFSNTLSLKSHISSVHKYKERYECEICDKKFSFHARLREHVRTVHVREAKYKCDECDDAFVHHNTFKNHMKRHRGEKIEYKKKVVQTPSEKLVCSTCGIVCASAATFKNHQKTHERLNILCPYCPRKFNHELNFNNHVKTHTTLPHLKCPFCPRTFRKSVVLNEHVVSHTGDKPYFCDMCGFRTGTLGRLNKHKKSQHMNHKYQCWVCPVNVNSSHGLVRHYMQHTREFPYRCSLCQKVFIIEANAKRHVEFHLKKGYKANVVNNLSVSYACYECGKQLRSFANLAVHLYTMHKKSKEELPEIPTQENELDQQQPLVKYARKPVRTIPDAEVGGNESSAERGRKSAFILPEPEVPQSFMWRLDATGTNVECVPVLTEFVNETIDITDEGTSLQITGGDLPGVMASAGGDGTVALTSGAVTLTSGVGDGRMTLTSGVGDGAMTLTSGVGDGTMTLTSGVGDGAMTLTSGAGDGVMTLTSGGTLNLTTTTISKEALVLAVSQLMAAQTSSGGPVAGIGEPVAGIGEAFAGIMTGEAPNKDTSSEEAIAIASVLTD